MPRNLLSLSLRLSLPLSVAALMAACAHAPGAAPTAAPAPSAGAAADCSSLGAQVAQAERDQRAALERQRDAWKVVVPFAVAARYAGAKRAGADADEHLAELQAEFSRRGCDRQAG
jgi:hypothetical protein